MTSHGSRDVTEGTQKRRSWHRSVSEWVWGNASETAGEYRVQRLTYGAGSHCRGSGLCTGDGLRSGGDVDTETGMRRERARMSRKGREVIALSVNHSLPPQSLLRPCDTFILPRSAPWLCFGSSATPPLESKSAAACAHPVIAATALRRLPSFAGRIGFWWSHDGR